MSARGVKQLSVQASIRHTYNEELLISLVSAIARETWYTVRYIILSLTVFPLNDRGLPVLTGLPNQYQDCLLMTPIAKVTQYNKRPDWLR